MSIGESIKALGQDLANAILEPQAIKNPEKLSKFCQVTKVVTLALAVLAVSSALFAGPISLFFAAVFAGIMYDTFNIACNIQEIAERSPFDDKLAHSFKDHLFYDVTKGTIFAKLIIGFIPKDKFASCDEPFSPFVECDN